jgi:hypothetical protein
VEIWYIFPHSCFHLVRLVHLVLRQIWQTWLRNFFPCTFSPGSAFLSGLSDFDRRS